MKETDLDYGTFSSPADKKIDNQEIQFEKNIQTLNDHFKKSDKIQQSQDLQSQDDSVSIVATIEPEEAVTIDVTEKKKNKEKSPEKKIKRSYIGVKLISIISTLVIVSMGLITVLVSYYVTKDTRANAETTNFTLNARTSSDAENRINSVISNVALFCDIFDGQEKSQEELSYDATKFFERNPDIAAIGLLTRDEVYTNSAFFITNDISPDLVRAYLDSEVQSIEKAKNGFTQIENSSPFFLVPVCTIFYPQQIGNKTEIVAAVFSTEKLSESISTGRINETYLVNDRGIALIHPDAQVMMQAADLSSNKFIKMVIENNTSGMQQSYVDTETEEEYFAACQKITSANCRVITQVKTSVILAAINATTRRNIALTVAILSIAILVIWGFAKSISVPLDRLTAVTDEINKGNFNTSLFEKLNVKRTDEIGILNRSTKAEQDILNTVTSLTNKGVTKAIVRKEIDFEPHLKDITVFFSDIRSFTSISDGFNKRFGKESAAQIINFLNDYMSRMVNCISITGGVVDKFEGDAIMAAWGVLRDDNLDYELMDDSNPEKEKLKKHHQRNVVNDAVRAIKATCAMRYALMKYNKDADAFTRAHKNEKGAQYKPHLKIGCGLNSGRATVGFMGSNEKMEFTSIGDAVNLASRTESSNKPCGTDILIAEDTYNLLKNDFIRCKENNYTIKPEFAENEIVAEMIPVTFSVKGKSAQHFYGIVNMPKFDIKKFFSVTDENFEVDSDCEIAVGPKGPKNLSEVRKILDIPEPDFAGVNLDEQENKISIS